MRHQHFLTPLQEAVAAAASDTIKSAILSSKAIKEIFSNFGDILNLAREVLRQLEASVSSLPIAIPSGPPSSLEVFSGTASIRAYVAPPLPIPRSVGAVLAPILPFLKCYSLFVRNFASAQAKIEQEEKSNETFRAFCKEKKGRGVGNRLNLAAMLLCVVQRIPRYRLLLSVSSNDLLLRFRSDLNDTVCRTS